MIKIKSFKELETKEFEFEYEDGDREIVKIKKSSKGNGWMVTSLDMDLMETELEFILKEIKKLNKIK